MLRRLRGDGNLVNFLPRHLQIRAARPDDTHLWIHVAFALVGPQFFRDWIVQRRASAADAHGPAETRLHGAFILIDRVKTGQQVTDDEPSSETKNESDASKREH